MFEPQASFASASNIYAAEGTCRRQAGALGALSFGSVFFVDTKKMNSAGGPNPAGVDFDFQISKLWSYSPASFDFNFCT